MQLDSHHHSYSCKDSNIYLLHCSSAKSIRQFTNLLTFTDFGGIWNIKTVLISCGVFVVVVSFFILSVWLKPEWCKKKKGGWIFIERMTPYTQTYGAFSWVMFDVEGPSPLFHPWAGGFGFSKKKIMSKSAHSIPPWFQFLPWVSCLGFPW